MGRSRGFNDVRRLISMALWSHRREVPLAETPRRYGEMLVGRRDLLRGATATAAFAAAPGLAGCGEESAPGTTSAARVAVVGAGIAGLHATWRLKQAGVDVTLYEAQSRVGGRMWTARDSFPDGLLFELGGELIDSNHATMLALADEFGIELDDRWADEPEGMIRETWFIDGARVSNETLLEQTRSIAATLAAQLEAAESDDEDAFAQWNNTSLQNWLDEFVPRETMPELHEVLRIAYVGEYGLEADQQSVLNMFYLFGFDSEDEFLIFGESDERWHTHLGNDTFTTALANAIGTTSVVTGAKLIRAEGPATGPYLLTFEGPTGTVEVDHVVFALPFTVLREVDLADLELSDFKREIIDQLAYGTNAKIMGHFTARPWWNDHNESGLLTSNLTIQQGWDSTIGQEKASGAGVWTNFIGGEHGANSSQGEATDVFDAAVDDLETVWPGSRAAWSGQAARMHWPTFAHAKGSYTCYTPGQWDYWSFEGTREGNVHFCGEHTSLDFQGWMEGAAESGGIVAQEVLDDLNGVAPASKSLAAPHALDSRPRWMPLAKRLRLRR